MKFCLTQIYKAVLCLTRVGNIHSQDFSEFYPNVAFYIEKYVWKGMFLSAACLFFSYEIIIVPCKEIIFVCKENMI